MNFKSAQRKFVENFQQTFIKMPFKLEMFAKFFYLYLDTKYKALDVFYCGVIIEKLTIFCNEWSVEYCESSAWAEWSMQDWS